MVSKRVRAASLFLLFLMTACTSKQSPLPALAEVANPQPVNTLWFKHVNTSTKMDLTRYTPVADGNQLFTSDISGDVGSVQLATGNTNWRIRLKSGASAGVAVGGGAVYVPTTNGEIYALNEKNGDILWHTTLPNQANTPATYADARLYVKTIDDKVTALNMATGQSIWTYDEGATQLQLLGSSRVVVAGNKVIAGFSDGKVDGINAVNGELIWQTTVATPQGFSDVAQMVGVYADPIISGETVFVATYHGAIAALDIDSGAVKWQHPYSTYANLAIDGNGLFAVNTRGNVSRFNTKNGNVVWEQKALAQRQLSGVAVDGNNVIVGDNTGDLHWLAEQDGHFVARTSLGRSAIATTPLVVSNKVIAVTQSGNIFVLGLAQ